MVDWLCGWSACSSLDWCMLLVIAFVALCTSFGSLRLLFFYFFYFFILNNLTPFTYVFPHSIQHSYFICWHCGRRLRCRRMLLRCFYRWRRWTIGRCVTFRFTLDIISFAIPHFLSISFVVIYVGPFWICPATECFCRFIVVVVVVRFYFQSMKLSSIKRREETATLLNNMQYLHNVYQFTDKLLRNNFKSIL